MSDILLINDNDDINNIVLKKINLTRGNDKITVSSTQNIRKNLTKVSFGVVILYEPDKQQCLKLIELISNSQRDVEIILLVDEIDSDFICSAYDCGIYDYLTLEDEGFAYTIKLINCLKYKALRDKLTLQSLLLENSGVLNSKNQMIKLKHLSEIFPDLREFSDVKNGTLAIITIDEKVKTKISINRLAGVLCKNLRGNDIVAEASNGFFYLILRNTNLSEAKTVINKLQDKMGTDIALRCGLNGISIEDFEVISKNTLDSLNCAINNNELCVSLSDLKVVDNWLDDGQNAINKQYKLFYTSFKHKLKNIIEPAFLNFQKECKTKFKDSDCIQYANEVECVFSLKGKTKHSELIIRYNGFTKLLVQITNKGLDSPENTKLEIPLNKFSEKDMNRLFKQLKSEYLERGDENA